MTVAELRSCRPEALEAAGSALLADRGRLARVSLGLRDAAPPTDWCGASGHAARERHQRLRPGVEHLQRRARTVAAALDLAAAALRAAQRALEAALDASDVPGALGALAAAEQADRTLARTLDPHGWDDARHAELSARLEPLRQRLEAEGETTMLVDLDALEAALAADPDLRLLQLDATGDHLRAAVAVGDVASADHVAVLVPGLGTTLAGRLAAGLRDTDRLLDRARVVDAAVDGDVHDTYAGVWFLDYEPPLPGPDVLEAADDERAERGSRELAGLVGLVDDARPDGVHVTVLGHSYGSLVVGMALRQPTGVDDAVVLGSPGLGTDDVGELTLPAGHGYLLEADLDPVGDLGWFGRDPSRLDGLTHLSTDEAVHRGERLEGIRGHTSYDDAGTTSLHNQAAVVAGHPEEAVGTDALGCAP